MFQPLSPLASTVSTTSITTNCNYFSLVFTHLALSILQLGETKIKQIRIKSLSSWRRQDYLEAGLSDGQIYIFKLDFLIF